MPQREFGDVWNPARPVLRIPASHRPARDVPGRETKSAGII